MLKSIREKDSREKISKEWFRRVFFVCNWAYLRFLVLSPFIVACCVNGNEFLHLCSTTNTLRNSCLVCTAHSLPLLRPLLFIINERNKCVTSSLINDGLNSIECRGVYHHQWSSTRWSFGYAFACLVSLMEDSFSACHSHSSEWRSWLERRCWLDGWDHLDGWS